MTPGAVLPIGNSSPGEKMCTACGRVKATREFPANRRCRDGLSSWCRACRAEAVRRWRDRRRAALAEPAADGSRTVAAR